MSKLTTAQIQNALKANIQEDVATDVTISDIEKFGNVDSVKEMMYDIAKYNQMLKERITFVNDEMTAIVPFTRENLYLICAYSGSGKSTIAANVSYPLWKEGKKSLVISNEESKQDVLFRIASLEFGYNFNDYKKGTMSIDKQKQCIRLFPEIAKYVKVIDVNAYDGITTKVEGVKKILTTLEKEDYSCIMIDYFQLIKQSTEKPSASHYEVLNDLRIWLGKFIKRANMPIVLFAQLHSIGKRKNEDLDSRIKDCPTIYEPATVVIEVIPHWEEKTSDFIIKKDRFGRTGKKMTFSFDNGRFVELTNEEKEKRVQGTITDIQEKVGISEEKTEQSDDKKV